MKTMQTLTETDCTILLKHITKRKETWAKNVRAHRNQLIILLMLDAGLRVGEVVQLWVSDLLYNCEPVLSIRVRPEIAKNHKEREIPVSQRLQEAIELTSRHYWSLHQKTPTQWAFFSRNPKSPLTRRQVQGILGTISTDCFGHSINPHMLRHTFATRLMRITSLAVVQQLLGHTSIKTTEIYLHADADDRKTAIGLF